MSPHGIGKTIFTAQEIQEKITEIAQVINGDYEGKELVVVSVLKGAIYFVADLTRQLTMPLNIDFLSIGVRDDETTGSRTVTIIKDLDINITDRHVLLVEDVIGTGLTLGYLRTYLEAKKPASLKICTLLDHPAGRLLNINIAYRCLIMPDIYVVGYGLDYRERYRNLPYIAEYHLSSRQPG